MSASTEPSPNVVQFLQEFSIPLLSGAFVALVFANATPDAYAHVLHWKPFGDVAVFGHPIDFHFLVNDIFMVFFFGIAAKEITESCLPGGSLNPVRKAINPLLATLGGVVGPVAAFFVGLSLLYAVGIYGVADDYEMLARGWGVPTATDIALAWLVARTVFGSGHPAVAFLLLLAVADDAVGLVIIAVFYGDPQQPVAPAFLGLVLLGMAIAWVMRRQGVNHWVPYIAIAGPLAWSGLVLAHLHAALALAFIVPFLPAPARDAGMFVDVADPAPDDDLGFHSALHMFEHQLKLFVDFGLFFFAFANAGVQFASIGPLTWLILGSLVVGKTIGIALLGLAGVRMGFPLPTGMTTRDLAMAGFVAALGLTVALFVADAAFSQPGLQGQAKMGALFSGAVGLMALALGRALGMRRAPAGAEPGTPRAED